MSAEPLACSLRARELAEREAQLRDLIGGAALAAVREGPGALRIELRDAPGLRERLARAIELERACCPFLQIAIADTEQGLALRIAGPAEAAPVIDGFERLASP